jgi:hypothetical protein
MATRGYKTRGSVEVEITAGNPAKVSVADDAQWPPSSAESFQ